MDIQKKHRPTGLKYHITKINPSWIKKGQRLSPKTEFQKGKNAGEKNPNWKGNKVGYGALHVWVRKYLGKAFWCTWCFSMKKIEWANISHQYLRDLNDWFQLCQKCHWKYDKNFKGLAIARGW